MVSEASGPCFHEADLNFENVYFEEETSTIFSENAPTKEKESLHQEAPAFCYGEVTNTAEEAEEEQPDEAAFQAEGVVNTGGSQEGRDASSWQDSAQKGEDEEDEGEEVEPGKRLLLAYTGDEHSSSQGDGARPSGESRPLTPEEDENTPVRNKEPGETESDEISYFQRVPEQDSRTERTEEDQLETHGSESEALKHEEEEEEEEEEQEEDEYDDGNNHEGEEEDEDEALTSYCQREVENPHWDEAAGDILDFLELKVQHVQDLLADDEEPVEKMKDFSGEDHQEAGESFAEYPSDFSSCEYIEREERDEESNGRCAGDPGTVRRATGSETLVVGNRETQRGKAELVETMSGDTPALRCEASDSDSSSDEEPRETLEDLENQLDEQHCGGRDHRLDDKEVPEVALCPAGSRGFSSGSLDDSFFSTVERQNPQISELEEEEEDECEESSNWEQEQERIRAFNEFDEDSDQLTGQEGTGEGEGEGGGHTPQVSV